MSKNIDHVQHIHSSVVLENKPKLPASSGLVEGELAVNYATGFETISLKNSSGDIVTFSSDEYYTEQKLGSGFTGENSAKTVTEVIEENEEIISASLNDLDDRKLDASAYTPTEEVWISGTGLNSVVQKGSSGVASGDYAVAEGYKTSATSNYSHAEGYGTSASGIMSHAEGMYTKASGLHSHAEGYDTKASGDESHAEGNGTTASGYSSHAEGVSTKAIGGRSHAEGEGTTASGFSSHAEGFYTKANGGYGSHAEGQYTIANNQSEHASGQYNVSSSGSSTWGDSGNTLFSVGNGTADNARHNAFEIRQNGDIYIVSGGTDILLQDNLGGNITIDQVIDSGTSASTNAVSTSAVYGFVTSYTPSITVDQVLDDTTSASTNPVSSKAVYDAVTDNELVWTNAYVTLSGALSSHTENTTIHVTAADKTAWNAKADVTDIPSVSGYADSVKYNSTSKYVEFYHGGTGGTKVFEYDASPFIIDGMVQNVEIKDVTSGASTVTCLVVSFNTDAGKQDINIPISDIFDANNYYTKTEVDSALSGKVNTSDVISAITSENSGSTNPIATKVIAENELIIATALNNLNTKKADTSAVTNAISDALTALSIASSAVTSMVGYAMAASGTPITSADTLNQAIGKLEKMIDEFKAYIEQKEFAIAAALNDLNERLTIAENIINNS